MFIDVIENFFLLKIDLFINFLHSNIVTIRGRGGYYSKNFSISGLILIYSEIAISWIGCIY